MEYLDLCRMREVSKPLKYTPLSVYVRKAFRISTWSLSRGLCFQVQNSKARRDMYGATWH